MWTCKEAPLTFGKNKDTYKLILNIFYTWDLRQDKRIEGSNMECDMKATVYSLRDLPFCIALSSVVLKPGSYVNS